MRYYAILAETEDLPASRTRDRGRERRAGDGRPRALGPVANRLPTSNCVSADFAGAPRPPTHRAGPVAKWRRCSRPLGSVSRSISTGPPRRCSKPAPLPGSPGSRRDTRDREARPREVHSPRGLPADLLEAIDRKPRPRRRARLPCRPSSTRNTKMAGRGISWPCSTACRARATHLPPQSARPWPSRASVPAGSTFAVPRRGDPHRGADREGRPALRPARSERGRPRPGAPGKMDPDKPPRLR